MLISRLALAAAIVFVFAAACGGMEQGQLTLPAAPGGKADRRGDDTTDPAEHGACRAETLCEGAPPLTTHSCVFVVGFDGSGVYSPGVGSNVGVLYEETRGPHARSGSKGRWSEVVAADTTRAYIEGVPGLPFGASRERVNRGLSAVCQHLDKRPAPCDIVLLGYSRGAFIANQLATALQDHGCDAKGRHKGAEIAFMGFFDPVNTQMGNEWRDHDGDSRSWTSKVPANVQRVVQVYKDPGTDPRGGIEGWTLTTSLLWGAKGYRCRRPMTHHDKSDGTPWHHGQIGHSDLTGDVIRCALQRSGIRL
jgi:hypothetical protein